MEFEKSNTINLLLDIYIEFLTKRQKQILTLYFIEDLSLGEISNILKISRTGVYDSIKKSVSKLQNLEAKLKILKKEKIKVELLKDFDNMDREKIKKKIKDYL